jgi:hypothetical protein
VTGQFHGSSDFNVPSTTGTAPTLNSAGVEDGFLLGLSPTDGAPIVATAFGGTSTDQGTGVAADSSGNAFVVGTYQSDSLRLGSQSYSRLGQVDSFVAVFKDNGAFVTSAHLYSNQAGGYARARGVATIPGGNVVVVVGDFLGNVIVDQTEVLPVSTKPAMFMIAFNAQLAPTTWGSVVGCAHAQGESVAIDTSSPTVATHVRVAGRFTPSDSCPLGTDTSWGTQPFVLTHQAGSFSSPPIEQKVFPYTTLLPRTPGSNGLDQEITFKLAASGSSTVLAGPYREATNQGAGGSRVDSSGGSMATMSPLDSETHGVAMDASLSYWVGGSFMGELVLAPSSGNRLTGVQGKRAAFAAAFAPDRFLWIRGFRSDTGEVSGAEMAMDPTKGPLFTGSFSGSLQLGNQALASNGGPGSKRDLFVMRFYK